MAVEVRHFGTRRLEGDSCAGRGRRSHKGVLVSALRWEKHPEARASGLGQAVRWKASEAGIQHGEAVHLVLQASWRVSKDL